MYWHSHTQLQRTVHTLFGQDILDYVGPSYHIDFPFCTVSYTSSNLACGYNIFCAGVDVEAARKEEQQLMLRDAHQWLNSRRVHDVRHPKSGGSALHVAAAKSYVDVLK